MGKIVRISGPVVVADDVENAKMFDVVRVGELGLVGEVIRITGNRSTIQVYEDTSGIRPGEKVENTNKPLSVDLGPGLLKSIYDGIQRPLDVIREKTGDFIQRGFTAFPLDEDKLWEFVPTAKKGDNVVQGQIIGTVQETGIINHKIMVPFGTSGRISEIREGKFKVSDTVAVIDTGNGSVNIRLKQEWPVRVPRKVQRKLPPEVPLITGQRVIDTFFPVAKGGTVAVPGPFGSGKCVTGETLVMTSTGEIAEIQELFRKYSGRSVFSPGLDEEYVFLQEDLGLYSLVNSRIEKSSTKTLYKGKSDSVVSILTGTGRRVRVTPVHKLFRAMPDGSVVETMAMNLRPGDHILSARKIESPQDDARIDQCILENAGNNYISTRKEILDLIANRKLPAVMNEYLGEFLGLYCSAGHSSGDGTVSLDCTGESDAERFVHLAGELFGVRGTVEKRNDMEFYAVLRGKIVSDFLKLIGSEAGDGTKQLSPAVLKSGDRVVRSFLRAYCGLSGDSSAADVQISSESRRLQAQLSYAMTRIGIMHSLHEETAGIAPSYRISVTGEESLGILSETHLSSAPDSGLKTGEKNSSAMRANRITPAVTVHTSGNEGSKGTIAVLETGSGKFPDSMDYVYSDRIVSAVLESGPFDVYDFAVPDYGSNFVGGHGGIILHNTVVQHQLSKWADSDIVVYVGCGERGNEMTEILTTFPELQDPKSGKPLMERTVLIANTSNMPVAAREASIYTGITIAEYYRDMGYGVALMADSTSRWAEALREISGRLEEMPGEEGYPAYLGRRLSEFYERSGNAVVVSDNDRIGSITIVGAVSPPGGDISEPVSQNTLRVTRVFWALDSSLASRRHFPSINWLNSYSLYQGDLRSWFDEKVSKEWGEIYDHAMGLLQKESELQEVVQLVGYDALPEREKNTLDIARMIREDFLQQSAFDEVDQYCSIEKQYKMLKAILELGSQQSRGIEKGLQMAQVQSIKARSGISRMKEVREEEFPAYFETLMSEIKSQIDELLEV
ncbi:MAG: V-type ATP synthase subunit A [Candidatus Thermoplasmatota archaeon]|nr:V-type ATP synthase subunit A [Candidatus Thermoplasmatota archaeon]MDA8142745.1 V-type ATP synthase subunit A [Thermoplasmatales archaeon]